MLSTLKMYDTISLTKYPRLSTKEALLKHIHDYIAAIKLVQYNHLELTTVLESVKFVVTHMTPLVPIPYFIYELPSITTVYKPINNVTYTNATSVVLAQQDISKSPIIQLIWCMHNVMYAIDWNVNTDEVTMFSYEMIKEPSISQHAYSVKPYSMVISTRELVDHNYSIIEPFIFGIWLKTVEYY